MQMQRDEPSLGELLTDLTREMSTLVRQEVTLAKTEITQQATSAGKDVGYMAAGGAIAYAGLLAIVAGLAILLSHLIPGWLAAFIVGAIVIGAGYMLIDRGRKELAKLDLMPKQTMQTLQEDAQWAKQQMS